MPLSGWLFVSYTVAVIIPFAFGMPMDPIRQGKGGPVYVLRTVPGKSGPGVRVQVRSSGVRSRVGRGFSERVAALTRLSCPVFGDR